MDPHLETLRVATTWSPRRAGTLGLLLTCLVATGLTGCSDDVVCEKPQDGTCMVTPRSECKGTPHVMTEADKEHTGSKNRGSDTCWRLGYTGQYLGGYQKPTP